MSIRLDYPLIQTLREENDRLNGFAEGLSPHSPVGSALSSLSQLINALDRQASATLDPQGRVELTDDKIDSITHAIPTALQDLRTKLQTAYDASMMKAGSPPIWSFGTSLGQNAPSTLIHTLDLVRAGHLLGAQSKVVDALQPLQSALTQSHSR